MKVGASLSGWQMLYPHPGGDIRHAPPVGIELFRAHTAHTAHTALLYSNWGGGSFWWQACDRAIVRTTLRADIVHITRGASPRRVDVRRGSAYARKLNVRKT